QHHLIVARQRFVLFAPAGERHDHRRAAADRAHVQLGAIGRCDARLHWFKTTSGTGHRSLWPVHPEATPVPPPRRTDDTNRSSVLLTHRQMGSPILLPALLGRCDTLRRFLAVADDFYGGIGHTELAQPLVGAARPPIAQRDVVLRRPALITV